MSARLDAMEKVKDTALFCSYYNASLPWIIIKV